MPLHPQKQTVTLCHSLLPAGWDTDCTSCHSREESGGRMDPDRAHSWSFRTIQKSDTGLLRDLSHLGFEVQKSQRWKWAHCPQNKMKSYVDILQSPLVKKNNLYFIIIWTLENFGRLLRSLSCAKWIGDPRSCVSHNEPLWVKCCCDAWTAPESPTLNQNHLDEPMLHQLHRIDWPAALSSLSPVEWSEAPPLRLYITKSCVRARRLQSCCVTGLVSQWGDASDPDCPQRLNKWTWAVWISVYRCRWSYMYASHGIIKGDGGTRSWGSLSEKTKGSFPCVSVNVLSHIWGRESSGVLHMWWGDKRLICSLCVRRCRWTETADSVHQPHFCKYEAGAWVFSHRYNRSETCPHRNERTLVRISRKTLRMFLN